MFERLVFLVGTTSLAILTLLVAETIFHGSTLVQRYRRKIAESVLYGLVSFLTIRFGLEIVPGVIVDFRGGVIGLALLTGGWSIGSVAVVAALLTRWTLGGAGMIPGLFGICADFLLVALWLRFFRGGWGRDNLPIRLLAEVGVLVGVSEAFSLAAVDFGGMSRDNVVFNAGILFLVQLVGTLSAGTAFRIRSSLTRILGQLRESEERFRNLVEKSPDMFYRFSTTRGAIYCSPQVETMLGYSVESIVQNPFGWKAKVHPDDLERKLEQVKQAGPDKSFEVEYRFRDSAGNWRWLRDRSIGISECGSETIINGIITDITALRQQQKLFREMFNLAPELICEVDYAGHLLQINPAWEKQLGYAASELLGRTVFEFMHPQDVEATRRMGDEINFGRRVQGFINRYQCKGGGYRHIEWMATRMPDTNHRLGIGRDVTERLLAETEIRAAHERMKCLIDNIPDPLWLKDSEGRYLAVNEAWKRIMRVESEEVVGKTARDLFSPELAERFEAEDPGMMESGSPIQMIEKVPTPQGGIEYYEAWKRAIRIGSSEMLGTVGCARNITARLQLESKLTKYRLLVDAVRDIILFINPETGRIVEANPFACSSYGYDRNELLSLSVFDLSPHFSPYRGVSRHRMC